jgi:hypothetical protein
MDTPLRSSEDEAFLLDMTKRGMQDNVRSALCNVYLIQRNMNAGAYLDHIDREHLRKTKC